MAVSKARYMVNAINQIFEQKDYAPSVASVRDGLGWLTLPELWEVAQGIGVTNYGPDRDQVTGAIVGEIETFLENAKQ